MKVLVDNHEVDASLFFLNARGKNMMLDSESVFYITPFKAAVNMTSIIVEEAKQRLPNQQKYTIIDATGNYGGNAITFAQTKELNLVSVCELNPVVYEGLVHNFKEMKLNTNIVNIDCIPYLDGYFKRSNSVDILFFDPPFGSAYKDPNVTKYQPLLSGLNMSEIAIKYKNVPIIAMKLPKDKFDIEGFKHDVMPHVKEVKYINDERFKFSLVIVIH